ncbi:MAG: hypothetical protein J5965_27790 [Aeriscardovia sp.]|nr:hypothetical protein [Aeriscardovia sp.]
MSKFHVETTKTTVIDGIEYNAKIDKYVNIDFSAARYTIRMWEDVHDAEIEFTPDNMDFLHELTEIFPLSEYDYRIIQGIYRHTKPHASLHFDIRNKDTGKNVYFAESAVLSDDDYNYIRDILVKEAPQYDWRTAERYIRDGIESFVGDGNITDLFTNDAWNYLSSMVSVRYKEFKTDGYVDFEDRGMEEVAKEILENALRSAYELQGEEKT